MNKLKKIDKLKIDDALKKRIRITSECNDCDYIPKVKNAGRIFRTKNYDYQLMHNGIKVLKDGYHGQGITEIIKLCNGHHEPQEEKAFHEILNILKKNKKKLIMIELGSHWSYYSLWFRKALKGSINYMIEPDINNLKVGRFNFSINNEKGFFIHAFISDKKLKARDFEIESNNEVHQIPSYSLDSFIKDFNIPYVDLVLVDIQGYELKMLKGAINTIKNKNIRFLFLSTHHHSISKDFLIHQKCKNFILQHDGKILCEHTIYESFSGDGLIVATFDNKDSSLGNLMISYNRYQNSIFNELEYDLCALEEENFSLTKKIKKRDIDNENLNQLINKIYRSRSWYFISLISKVKNFIFKK